MQQSSLLLTSVSMFTTNLTPTRGNNSFKVWNASAAPGVTDGSENTGLFGQVHYMLS